MSGLGNQEVHSVMRGMTEDEQRVAIRCFSNKVFSEELNRRLDEAQRMIANARENLLLGVDDIWGK